MLKCSFLKVGQRWRDQRNMSKSCYAIWLSPTMEWTLDENVLSPNLFVQLPRFFTPWSYSVFPKALDLRIIKCKIRVFCYVHYQWHASQKRDLKAPGNTITDCYTNFCIRITPAMCDVKEIGLKSFVLTLSPDPSVQFPRFLTLRSNAVLITGRCMRLCLFSNVWSTKKEISSQPVFYILLTPAME